jgi:glycosyltransferase involved in cell wall biosynthesis
MKVAVVVPVKNEIDGLGGLVTSLQGQVSEGDEIIFVDAGSSDGTQGALRDYAARDPRIRLLISEGAFPGRARNLAIRHTNAEIIAQIDGGNHPDEHWLQNLVAPMLRGKADYSMGAVKIMPVRRRILGRIMDMGALYGASLHRTEFRDGSDGPPAGGASVAYWRWIWEKTGGFPEWLRYGEDPLYVRRVMQLKPRISFTPDAILYWQLGPTLRHVLRRQIHRAANTFHDPVTLRCGLQNLFASVLLFVLMAAACVLPFLWIPVALGFGSQLALQTAKSLRTYCRREKPEAQDLFRALLIFPIVEGLGMMARFAGTVQGLFWLRNARAEWGMRRRYIAGELPA